MSEWNSFFLSDIAEIRVSNVDKKIKPGEMSVLLCNYMDAYSNNYINSEIEFMQSTATAAEIGKFKINAGDVVITKDSETPFDIGIPSVIVDEIPNLVCGYHLALVKPKGKIVNSIFLAKILASEKVHRYFARVAAGSTRYGLSNGAIAKTKFCLPPIAHQNSIAAIFQTIDQAIEKTEALIEKYGQIKAGMMHDLFTRGLTPDGKLRPPHDQAPDLYQETPIGWIPKEWALRTLGTMSNIASGITLNSKFSPDQSVSIPYLRVANVQDGYLDLVEMKEVQVSKQTVARYALQKGDVLMNEGGDFDKLGRGTVWPGEIEPCIHQNHVFRVRTENAVIRPFFLAYWSQSSHGKKYFLLSSKQSTNLASINSKQLNAYPIGVPTLKEQKAIEDRVGSVIAKISSFRVECSKLKKQKSGLMHDLLTGKVPVKVGEPKAAHV